MILNERLEAGRKREREKEGEEGKERERERERVRRRGRGRERERKREEEKEREKKGERQKERLVFATGRTLSKVNDSIIATGGSRVVETNGVGRSSRRSAREVQERIRPRKKVSPISVRTVHRDRLTSSLVLPVRCALLDRTRRSFRYFVDRPTTSPWICRSASGASARCLFQRTEVL